MQKTSFLAIGLWVILFGISSLKGNDRPNFVLVFADDQGWKDVGYQSNGAFLTPNIDRLASEGMIFTDAYAAAGNCAPSRACLLSGSYTPRHHLYAVKSTARGPKNLRRLIPVPNRDGLGAEFVTLAEALKEAGYATGHFGKWHLAGKDGELPSRQGFHETFDSFGNGELPEGATGNKKGPPDDPKGVFTLTQKACDFIERNKDQPFFCYLPHHAIHGPLQMRPSTAKTVANHLNASPPPDFPSDSKIPSASYLGCNFDLDASVGMLLAKLKELSLEENTIVVYTSDNGATKGSSQEPLRGNKGCYYEGGIREPFVVRWPGQIQAGSVCSTPISLIDLYPTFLAAAGITPPKRAQLDGENLLPLMKQTGELKRRSIFWHFPGYLDKAVIRGRDPVFRTRPVSVIRKGNWKLHLFHEEWQLDGGRSTIETNNAVELYNLVNDIGERKNVASMEIQKRDELLDDLFAWFKSTDAVLPSQPNPDYDINARPSKSEIGKGKSANKKE